MTLKIDCRALQVLVLAAILQPSLSFGLNSFRNVRAATTLFSTTSAPITRETTGTTTPLEEMRDEYDVVVIGSGIGGLSAAAILSSYGYSVAVMESHYAPGGAAHGYSIKDKAGGVYHFDTGPSFFSGLNPTIPAKSSNPLRTVLDAIDETVECIPYTTFGLKFPEGNFVHTTNFGGGQKGSDKESTLEQVAGTQATKEWSRLMQAMEPLAKAVEAMPTAALRGDPSALVTAAPFLKNFASLNPLENLKLTQPYSKILDNAGIQNTFTRNWLDLLCFCLSGLPASGTITAEMAMMMGEFYDDDAIMDCPKGGANAIVDALVRGITKNGGQVFTKSHVQSIVIDDDQKRATGIQLKRNDRVVKAKKAVISNLSIWDLLSNDILDTSVLPDNYVREGRDTPVGKSFMHLHLGFKATREELEQLQAHYMHIDDWSRGVEAQDNAVLVSIPSVHDESLAPAGHGVLHAYTPATEDYAPWAQFRENRNSPEYKAFKEQRSQYLWDTLEKIIPDIRERSTTVQIGTPLTHERFLKRYRGSYGPSIVAGEGSFPFPKTPLQGLLVCGDSCFPGIGVPAVAGSGLLAAHSVSLDSIPKQQELLRKLAV